MGINSEKICESINNVMSKIQAPAMMLPKYLLMCSAMQSPGASWMDASSQIIRDMENMGIPVGPNPDGTPNLIVGLTASAVKNTMREMKIDGVIHSIIPKGALQIVSNGGNAGGPVVSTGFNISDIIIYGKSR